MRYELEVFYTRRHEDYCIGVMKACSYLVNHLYDNRSVADNDAQRAVENFRWYKYTKDRMGRYNENRPSWHKTHFGLKANAEHMCSIPLLCGLVLDASDWCTSDSGHLLKVVTRVSLEPEEFYP